MLSVAQSTIQRFNVARGLAESGLGQRAEVAISFIEITDQNFGHENKKTIFELFQVCKS